MTRKKKRNSNVFCGCFTKVDDTLEIEYDLAPISAINQSRPPMPSEEELNSLFLEFVVSKKKNDFIYHVIMTSYSSAFPFSLSNYKIEII